MDHSTEDEGLAPSQLTRSENSSSSAVQASTCDLTRRSFLALAALATSSLALGACSSDAGDENDSGSGSESSDETGADAGADTASEAASDDPYATGTHHATIEVTDYGTISVALNANEAPITVANFAKLANEGFYDGLTFHRVVADFMIQGGDPNGDGTGGSGETIKGEFSANGVTNNIAHVRGTISMARSSDYDSASSQFFIMQKAASSLDGEYAAFGNVTDGIEVVDAIVEATASQGDSNGILPADVQPKIASITMVD